MMENSKMQLNAAQLAGVNIVDKHLRIIAGAGSGKTAVLTNRIVHLIEDLNVSPLEILAITFTNKAANEMKKRVERMLNDYSSGIVISTIHSLCVRILRQDIYVLGYPRNFTILDTDDQKTILKEAYALYDIDVKAYRFGSVMNYISTKKYGFISAKYAKELAGNETEEIYALVYEYYEQRLKELFALDFDDLLLKTLDIFLNYPDKLNKWKQRFRYLHVDEFQDVDNVQYELIKCLVGEGAYLCVVGDPDQTIYTWRGAKISIILDFEKDFKPSQTIYLNENYRSTKDILGAANSVIKNNKHRLEKDLFTSKPDGHKVLHYTAYEEEYEAKWVIERIEQLVQNNEKLSEIAILYRSNYLSRLLEKNLVLKQISYVIYGGLRFYDRAEIKDLLAYLRVVVQQDDLALKRIINVPKRKVGPKTIDGIFANSKAEGLNMYNYLLAHGHGKGMVRNELSKFVEMIEASRKLLEEELPSRILEKIISDSGYLAMLESEKEIERIENVKELLNDLINYEENSENPSLDEYLQLISLLSDQDNDDEQERVTLMTVHAAKGLEFDNVFVYSMSEGIFPSERSISEGGQSALEEERRLAYVAFTRARKQLFVSDAKGYSFMLKQQKQTSRFINEIEQEHITHHGAVDILSELTRVKEVVSQKPPTNPRVKYRKGDLIEHEEFGNGVIISIKDDIATIAFNHGHGLKKLNVNYAKMQLKSR